MENTKKLIESKPKGFFKGIIPVDFAGLPVDLEKFKDLANKHIDFVDEWIESRFQNTIKLIDKAFILDS